MGRRSKIEELGIEKRVMDAYERLGDYTAVAQELTKDGYAVSMVQVERFLKNNPIAPCDSDGELFFGRRNRIIPYPVAASIFDVMLIADNNYHYLATRLNSVVMDDRDAVGTVAEIRKNMEFAVNAMAKAAEYGEQLAFEQEVINAISEADPVVAAKILNSLKSRNALRSTVVKSLNGSS